MKFEIVLKYKNKIYKIREDWETDLESMTYHYEEGNLSCDCNMSERIKEQCNPEFKEMPCGMKIDLISIKKL